MQVDKDMRQNGKCDTAMTSLSGLADDPLDVISEISIVIYINIISRCFFGPCVPLFMQSIKRGNLVRILMFVSLVCFFPEDSREKGVRPLFKIQFLVRVYQFTRLWCTYGFQELQAVLGATYGFVNHCFHSDIRALTRSQFQPMGSPYSFKLSYIIS